MDQLADIFECYSNSRNEEQLSQCLERVVSQSSNVALQMTEEELLEKTLEDFGRLLECYIDVETQEDLEACEQLEIELE